MGRTVYVYREGRGVIPKDQAESRDYASAMVIRDSMDDLRHPITGEMIDSKSKFRQITKAHGAIELGNDRITPRRSEPDVKAEVGRAMEMLKVGYRPAPISHEDWER